MDLALSYAETNLTQISFQLAHGRNRQMSRRFEPTPVVTEIRAHQTGRIWKRQEKRTAGLESLRKPVKHVPRIMHMLENVRADDAVKDPREVG